MPELSRCPQCNAELPENALEGLCPRCLMKQAMGTASPEAAGPSPTTPWQTTFTPPDPVELSESFPQLEILELLGQGGMGAVYRAKQIGLDRFVALKILPREAAADPAFAERFTREARALAQLNHPNIVAVYDSGQLVVQHTDRPPDDDADPSANRLYYFLMEYVDGVNLRQAMAAATLTPAQALEIVPQVCEALQYAHDQGIVHRDIKPENVLLDKTGKVKVADFGLSKLLNRAPVNVTLTASHQVMGTLHYMAPEQMQRPLEVDHRADIYSLGVVLYELLTGDVPLGRYPLPSEKLHTDARLDEVVLKAMEREPDRRYQQASEVKTDIESLGAVVAESPPVAAASGKPVKPAHLPPDVPIDDDAMEAARRDVQGPAIGLVVAGAINLVPIVLLILGIPFFLSVDHRIAHAAAGPGPAVGMVTPAIAVSGIFMPGIAELAIILLMFGINLPVGVLMVIGGLKMRKLDSYGLAMAASVGALLPGATCVIGLPIGVWSLVVLNRPEVKAAFQRRRYPLSTEQAVVKEAPSQLDRADAARRLRGPAIGLIVVALLTVLPAIAAVVLLLVRLLSTTDGVRFP